MKFRRVMDTDAQGQRNPIYQSLSSYFASPYSYEQTIRVGFPTESFSGGHGGPDFPERLDMRDAIQWEIEKERIREEIIAEEMARKRRLEMEVRHELMLERQNMAMSTGGVFPSRFMPLQPPPSHSNLLEPGFFSRQPIGLEERIILSLDEKNVHGHGSHRPKIRGFDVVPFQRFADSNIIERTPTPLSEIRQKEVIVLGKPNSQTLTGSKRKLTSLISTGESSEFSSDTSKKTITEEWSCAICQVTATSESGLNDHLKGKKHQAKEAALVAQKTGANFGLGGASKNPVVNPVKLAVKTVDVKSGKKKRKNRKVSSASTTPSTDNNTSSSNGSNNWKKENESRKAEKDKDTFKFWCEMCKVGAFSEDVMNSHREGKKHTANLVELLQKGKSVIPFDIEEKSGNEIKEMDAKLVEEEEEEENVTSVSI